MQLNQFEQWPMLLHPSWKVANYGVAIVVLGLSDQKCYECEIRSTWILMLSSAWSRFHCRSEHIEIIRYSTECLLWTDFVGVAMQIPYVTLKVIITINNFHIMSRKKEEKVTVLSCTLHKHNLKLLEQNQDSIQ